MLVQAIDTKVNVEEEKKDETHYITSMESSIKHTSGSALHTFKLAP